MVKLGKLFGKGALKSKATAKPTNPASSADPPGPRSSQIGAAREIDNVATSPIEERDDGNVKATFTASSEEDERSADMETMDEDFTRLSDDDQTYDDGTFCNTTHHGAGDAYTYGETALVSKKSDASATSTVKGDDPTKKYFHKDVVLNSLDDGMNNLVIRAMYFVPKPKQDHHVVVKVEVSCHRKRSCDYRAFNSAP